MDRKNVNSIFFNKCVLGLRTNYGECDLLIRNNCAGSKCSAK